MAGKGGTQAKYRNPCLTMHQPWASLIVNGIKRVEGRSWSAPIRGRLWIHAASKVPEEETIKAMEDFYREVYEMDGIKYIKFPEHYPTSRLLGCVEVVGCVTNEELKLWEGLPSGVKLEGQREFCWLCEQPQRLLVPFEMRGYQGVYNLEKKIHQAAVRGLVPADAPWSIKFPLPIPQSPFSMKPSLIQPQATPTQNLERGISAALDKASSGVPIAANRFMNNFPPDSSTSSVLSISNSSSYTFLEEGAEDLHPGRQGKEKYAPKV